MFFFSVQIWWRSADLSVNFHRLILIFRTCRRANAHQNLLGQFSFTLLETFLKQIKPIKQAFPGSVALFSPLECNQELCAQYLWQSCKPGCFSVAFELYCLHLVSHHFFMLYPKYPPATGPCALSGQTHSPVCQNQLSTWTHNIHLSLLSEAQRLTSEDETGSSVPHIGS